MPQHLDVTRVGTEQDRLQRMLDGRIGYASYRFSYTAKIKGAEGRRVSFHGMSKVHLDGELIKRYEEIFERAPVLVKLGFPDERIVKSVRKWASG